MRSRSLEAFYRRLILASLAQRMPEAGIRRSRPNPWHRCESLMADSEMKRVYRRLKSASATQGFCQGEPHIGLRFWTIPEVPNVVNARPIGINRPLIVTC
jgi:hypothetical protein